MPRSSIVTKQLHKLLARIEANLSGDGETETAEEVETVEEATNQA